MTKSNKGVLLGLGLIACLLIYYFSSPFSPYFHRFEVAAGQGSAYYHFWHFSGVTTKEYVEGPAYTIDEANFPITSNIDEVVEGIKYAVIAHVTKELVDQLGERGYVVTVNNIYPTVRLEQRKVVEQFRDYTKITIYSKLVIDCDAEFETDKPLAESPLPVWVLVIVGMIMDKLPVIILATIVGLGIYAGVTIWANSFFVDESIIEIEYYDEEGNLIKKERTYHRGTNWESMVWMIIATIVAGVVAIIVIPRIWTGKKE